MPPQASAQDPSPQQTIGPEVAYGEYEPHFEQALGLGAALLPHDHDVLAAHAHPYLHRDLRKDRTCAVHVIDAIARARTVSGPPLSSALVLALAAKDVRGRTAAPDAILDLARYGVVEGKQLGRPAALLLTDDIVVGQRVSGGLAECARASDAAIPPVLNALQDIVTILPGRGASGQFLAAGRAGHRRRRRAGLAEVLKQVVPSVHPSASAATAQTVRSAARHEERPALVATRQLHVVLPVLDEWLGSAAEQLFDSLDTDWLALDCELLPWSAKAIDLIKAKYASVGAAARSVLPGALAVLQEAAARGLGVGDLEDRSRRRLENDQAFRDACAAYVRPTDGLDGVTLAPFQILASEGRALALTESHGWHLSQLAMLEGELFTPTRHRFVDLASQEERDAATQWWPDLTASGGEGMVVKPAHLTEGRIQPGIKMRGREYLRIIYGPDYTDSLDVLRQRHLGKKGQLAQREHGLGIEALSAFVDHEPLWKVHQSVFAVLALESEPVDPRL